MYHFMHNYFAIQQDIVEYYSCLNYWYILPVFLLQIYYTASWYLVCKLPAQFEQEYNQIDPCSSGSRCRIYLDTPPDLYIACGIHQTVHDFDLFGVPNSYDTFAFYREAMLLLLVFYSL